MFLIKSISRLVSVLGKGLPILTSQINTKKNNQKPCTIAPCPRPHATKCSNQSIHTHAKCNTPFIVCTKSNSS